jgi:hypothetical protein
LYRLLYNLAVRYLVVGLQITLPKQIGQCQKPRGFFDVGEGAKQYSQSSLNKSEDVVNQPRSNLLAVLAKYRTAEETRKAHNAKHKAILK